MSIFSASYPFITGIEYDVYVDLPARVREELLFAALLLPVAFANIRAPLDPEISATDATPDSRGSCVATVSKTLAMEMYRLAEHRRDYTRLDSVDYDIALRPYSMTCLSERYQELVLALPWRDLGGFGFCRVEHVNTF